MKINSNIQAMIANNVLQKNEKAYSASTEKLSSGYRINSAKDSPSGMAITNRMSAQLKSLGKAKQNSANAINAIEIAEGAMSEIQSILQRMNELAVKGSNGTNTTADREAIQIEVDALKKEIERITEQTEYNTQPLLNGEIGLKGYSDKEGISVISYNDNFKNGDFDLTLTKDADGNVTASGSLISTTDKQEYKDGVLTITQSNGGEIKIGVDESSATAFTTPAANLSIKSVGGMKIQVGSSEGQEIQVSIPRTSLFNMGIEELDMSTLDGCREGIAKIGGALDYISKARSSLGAYENRLEDTVSNLNVSIENLTGAYSTIKDIDMAEEMVEYTKLQVLVQAGTSMLTQANEQPQQALQLLQ